MSSEAIQPVIVAFPALASWMIVGLASILVLLAGVFGKVLLKRLEQQDAELLKRLDAQDAELVTIRSLLDSEIKTLREMQHAMDLRVTRIETSCAWLHQAGRDGRDGRDAVVRGP